ncbi:MAG: hypothetical protein A2126_02170 [Candidatus Woykebacteria bacterium GWB1_45_5]|uniref:Methylaspartate mutase n=2 Tax=Candidatus Woykeibacteriota TaxID=1817899 RepID=A0A1G1W331_9BACT|nr:MAG: hypothetical protein A2113_02590 [Candidatus Woykebacteria bacterium GWA1_44_8]OGY23936.1 MAG: hypothetical protein A2126_02170 [Candidatus Woykebacteria bacterium GWB1_45_5]
MQQKFVTIDIGSSWTKLFLVNLDEQNLLNVERSVRLPTSLDDLSITINSLLSQIPKENGPKIFVSNLEGVEKLAKEAKAEFVKEEEATGHLTNFLREADSDCVVLDAGASNLGSHFVTEAVGKFLTFPINEITLENFFGNRRFRPHILPKNTKELEIEEAYARNYLAECFSGRPKEKKVLVAASGGPISGTPSLVRAALLISDILGAGDVAQVFFDREFFLPSFAALLARYKQLEAANLGAWFEPLGAFVSLGGSSQLSLDWGYSETQEAELGPDEISLIPAPTGQRINLSFTLPPAAKEKKTFSVTGGSLGILLDARAKPLPLSFGQETSRHQVAAWQKEVEKVAVL